MIIGCLRRLLPILLLILSLMEGTPYPFAAFAAALLHEAAHTAAAFFLKIPLQDIRADIGGIRMGYAFFKGTSYPAELITAAAGPVCNILCTVGVFLTLHFHLIPPSPPILFFSVCSLMYAFFNLLPVDSLDGGAIIRAVCGWFDTPDTGEKVLSVTTPLSIFFLWIIAVYNQLVLNGNFSVLILSLFFLFKAVFAKNPVAIP